MGELGGVFKWAIKMGEILGVVFKWPTKIGVILDAILVNRVVYLSGPLKWVQFW